MFDDMINKIRQRGELVIECYPDFIMVPLIVGIVCAGIYGLFELFVRKKERLAIIEKIGDKLEP